MPWDSRTLGAAVGDLDCRGNGVWPVQDAWSGGERNGLGVRQVRVVVAGRGGRRLFRDQAARPLPSIGMTPYLPASTYQVAMSSMSLSRLSAAATLWFSAKSFSTWYSSHF